MQSNDTILIIIALIGGIVALTVIIGFIGQGNARHIEIFWPEKVDTQ